MMLSKSGLDNCSSVMRVAVWQIESLDFCKESWPRKLETWNTSKKLKRNAKIALQNSEPESNMDIASKAFWKLCNSADFQNWRASSSQAHRQIIPCSLRPLCGRTRGILKGKLWRCSFNPLSALKKSLKFKIHRPAAQAWCSRIFHDYRRLQMLRIHQVSIKLIHLRLHPGYRKWQTLM